MIYPNPQIYHSLRAIFVHVPKTGGTSIERSLSGGPIVGGHTTSLGFRKAFPDQFSSYFKFSVVRHPLDRFISAYNYLIGNPVNKALSNEIVHSSGSLDSFISLIDREPDTILKVVHLMPQHSFICDTDGSVLVDKVYRFDQLHDGWKDVCGRLGVEKPLPHLNASKSTGCFSLDKVLPVIQRVYSKDFSIFDYKP